jgi:signal transduction histidine kinase
VLACAFMAIRRLLSPLKKLSAGVERVGRGELGYQVPVCGHDEFGDLASSFNTMSSRLAALVRAREQLLLDVSHELRSPITRIKVALEMAPEGTDTEGIRDDLREMETMIGEILEAARLDSVHGKLNIEELDLGVLVSEAVADANIRPPGAVLAVNAAATDVSGSGPMIKVDRARVRKVLANVLDNAVKFSQAATQSSSGEKGVPVEVRIEADDSEVTVRVKDRGAGIPADELANLFEPFYRVDRSRSRDTGGYGLGLSLCKRIMEAHGGSIGITSREGEGTEVFLVFPVH